MGFCKPAKYQNTVGPNNHARIGRSGANSTPRRLRPRLWASVSRIARAALPSGPGRAWVGSLGLGACSSWGQAPRSQSSGGDWSKPAASVSSSQGPEAKPDGRAGARGGARGGRFMDSRMRFAIVGSVIAANTRIESPHSHRSASTPKTRFNKSAQGRCRGRPLRGGRGDTAG